MCAHPVSVAWAEQRHTDAGELYSVQNVVCGAGEEKSTTCMCNAEESIQTEATYR